MIIDVHVHPALFSDICTDKERMKKRMDEMGYDLMSSVDLNVIDKQNRYAEIDKMVLLPLDHSTICGEVILSNEEIKKLVDARPNQFIGFASVDPHREDALEVLDHAFSVLGLSGLKLNPSKQRFKPDDDKMFPIYQKCLEYNKPIIFHAGLSWEPNTLAEYSHPLRFEKIALTFPKLRICLAHFGWPWVQDTAMLLIKYSNVYTDTAMMYMDSPELFFDKVFNQDIGRYWLDNNFPNQVMFGSNAPRFRPVRIKRGLDSIEMREDTRRKVYGENAVRFLGLEV
ncbi:amidohydrolase family protein [Clostridium beijerinckii]|jgi:predicted TIM-barrel fold metal-dependent hydrolase|uniref:Amidohydrolase n=1 Tax=Clostridium beijerinckii TaxID=1520 RepID=A0A1S8S3P9_CLOBE|nr:amidohydrolase family protein [Clostridium beijerinckii]NRY60639.1 hypothetical protein [Clostridium beijerinckii]OOM60039.1 amidohydrolase [Clostridium beijerinckii]OOP74686.1 amidohydrolase [Clostridium beijerinckii]